MRGVSDEASELADGRPVIPMMGMVDSLNVSVACAVVLYEALRQRRQAGHVRPAEARHGELAESSDEWLRR